MLCSSNLAKSKGIQSRSPLLHLWDAQHVCQCSSSLDDVLPLVVEGRRASAVERDHVCEESESGQRQADVAKLQANLRRRHDEIQMLLVIHANERTGTKLGGATDVLVLPIVYVWLASEHDDGSTLHKRRTSAITRTHVGAQVCSGRHSQSRSDGRIPCIQCYLSRSQRPRREVLAGHESDDLPLLKHRKGLGRADGEAPGEVAGVQG